MNLLPIDPIDLLNFDAHVLAWWLIPINTLLPNALALHYSTYERFERKPRAPKPRKTDGTPKVTPAVVLLRATLTIICATLSVAAAGQEDPSLFMWALVGIMVSSFLAGWCAWVALPPGSAVSVGLIVFVFLMGTIFIGPAVFSGILKVLDIVFGSIRS